MSKNKALSDFVSDINNAAVGDYLFLDSAGDRTIARQVLGSDISGFTAPYDSAGIVSLLDSNYVDTKMGGGSATSITGADVNSKLAALDNSVVPTTSMNLGSTTKKWRNIYTNKLSFGGISIDTNGLDGGNATLSGFTTPSDYVLVNNIVLSTPAAASLAVTNSSYTSFLLKTDSTQTDAQVDASSNSLTITENGNVTSTAFSPYHPKGYSVYFDGTSDYLRIPYDASFSYSSSTPFTIDMWFYPTVSGTDNQHIASSNTGSVDANLNWLFRQKADNTLRFVMIQSNGTVVECDSSNTMNINEWNHVSVVMTGSSIKHWLNGIFQQEVSFNGSMKVNGNIDLGVWGSTYFNGYITDFRYNVGEEIYTGTADINVPTERLTTNSYTKVLACHLPYIADGSSNDFSITVVGDVYTHQFGPYDHVTYSPSSHGGSVYLDGSGDYLSCGSGLQFDMGTGDFTWEAWVYPMQASRSQQIISVGDSNSTIAGMYFRSTNKFAFYANSTLYLESASTYLTNKWYHVAVARSGTNLALYVNGKSVDTATNSANIGSSSEGAYVGTNYGISPQQDMNGFISNVRVVKGTAVYTSAFTPPTQPLTAITNTQLLTCTNKNNVWNAGGAGNGFSNLLQGNAILSTSITKNESASVQLDGTGDYIKIDNTNPIFNVSTGDFTWEGWFRFNAFTDNPKIFINLASASVYWQLYVYNNALRLLGNAGNTLSGTASGTLSTSTWYHIALVRVGNVFNVYLDGSLAITDSYGGSIGHNSDYGVGGTSTYPNNNINGNVEGVRLSKYARYTSAFTPPTAALEG